MGGEGEGVTRGKNGWRKEGDRLSYTPVQLPCELVMCFWKPQGFSADWLPHEHPIENSGDVGNI